MSEPAATPPPIPGRSLDKPPKDPVDTLRKVEKRNEAAGAGLRAFFRFSSTRASLLAAGTTYYLFLSLFALLTLAFGLTARLGADRLTTALNNALATALPGLEQQLNPQSLAEIGERMTIVGLVVLLYSGSGVMVAAADSVHQIYGAPKDGRNFVVARLRLIAWLMVLGPLVLLSFAASLLVNTLAGPILDALGVTATTGGQIALQVGTAVAALALDVLILFLILGHLGGIQPARRARLGGAVVGAIGIEVLKSVTALIVGWSVAKPQYGAFAVPITILLILYLMTLVTYAAAAVTAALAEQHPETAVGSEPHPDREPAPA